MNAKDNPTRQLYENFLAMGLSDQAAKIAAVGRDPLVAKDEPVGVVARCEAQIRKIERTRDRLREEGRLAETLEDGRLVVDELNRLQDNAGRRLKEAKAANQREVAEAWVRSDEPTKLATEELEAVFLRMGLPEDAAKIAAVGR